MTIHHPPLLGITGWKNSGKTRMAALLISEFSKRGLNVSTIKHAHHAFDVDQEGTDSWQHRQAGAGEVALVSSKRWALMHELGDAPEPKLVEILEKLGPCDLVILEGFKRENHAKIEMQRQGTTKDQPLWPNDPSIIALCNDQSDENCKLPQFAHDEVEKIADFAEKHLQLGPNNVKK